MSRLLLVAFDAAETTAAHGFLQRAEALGLQPTVLQLTGDAGLSAFPVRLADLAEVTSDGIGPALAEFAREFDIVAGQANMAGKDLLAYVAGRLDRPMVSDVTEVVSPTEYVRPIVAGSVIARTVATGLPLVVTYRLPAFPSSAPPPPAASESIPLPVRDRTKIVRPAERKGGRPDLSQAKVVVSGGRPLKDSATFERVLGGLADQLGGAVGATRAAVDSGIAPNELQVGQTGKIVAPDLYIAAGVSGSTQHMAGIKDSKVIVAINKDPDAPIFESADFGLVADLYDAIPALQKELGG